MRDLTEFQGLVRLEPVSECVPYRGTHLRLIHADYPGDVDHHDHHYRAYGPRHGIRRAVETVKTACPYLYVALNATSSIGMGGAIPT